MQPTSPNPAATKLPGAFSLFKPSWEAVKLNLNIFFILGLVFLVLSTIKYIPMQSSPGLASIFSLISAVVLLVVSPAWIFAQLKSARHEKVRISEALQKGFNFLWRYLGLSICLGVVIGVGFLLFIIPGIFMIRRYYLSPYYLIDRDMKVFDAMKASAADSKRFSSAIWGVLGVNLLIGLLCFLLVGFVLLLMYSCAPALRYYQIMEASGDKATATPVPLSQPLPAPTPQVS